MIVRDTARTYPANKTSSGVRTLEDVKRDLAREQQTIKSLQESIEDYDNGWADDFEDNPRKRARMEQRLKTAEDNYAGLKMEYEHHPDGYADKYKDVGGAEKAFAGIIGSATATVPVIAETVGAALKEAEDKLSADEYMSALQAEEIAWNKMNDYVSSHFGSYDMIDPVELEGLEQESLAKSEYRKSLEPKYEEPVAVQPFTERASHDCESDMDSWGMNLMRESAWLKNSATENLDGIWKTGADIIIDEAQSAALLPLLLGGPKVYLAGVAANAAAEKMYAQTEKEKPAGEALLGGMASAGMEVANDKLSDSLKKKGKSFVEWLEKIWEELD